jgi:hypothetical protein
MSAGFCVVRSVTSHSSLGYVSSKELRQVSIGGFPDIDAGTVGAEAVWCGKELLLYKAPRTVHFQAHYSNQPGLEECVRDLFEWDEALVFSVSV